MRSVTALCVLSFCTLVSATARAEQFVVNVALGTTAAFQCRSSIVCSGEGTDTLTFGSGDNTASLKFTGVSTTFPVTTQAHSVSLGEIEFTASPGFTFPTHPANPNLPIVRFFLFLNHAAPTLSSRSRQWLIGPGGQSDLSLQSGSAHFTFLTTNPGWPLMVYTTNPFPFTLSPNSITNITADVGAVPEPASMLLLGTGLAGAALARRRQRRTQRG